MVNLAAHGGPRGGGPCGGGGPCTLGIGLVPVCKHTGTNPRSHSEVKLRVTPKKSLLLKSTIRLTKTYVRGWLGAELGLELRLKLGLGL